MKISTLYICGKCGYQSGKWVGKCPACEAWNSFTQEEVKRETAGKKAIKAHSRTPLEYEKLIQNLKKDFREQTGINEVDMVLGGGIVPGSMILLTGEPGIGKSTLTLQIANQLCGKGKRVLYVSGEESEEQISIRGARLGLPLKNLKLLSESNLETILATANEEKTDFLIVDSIQVVSSQNIPGGAGSVSQVRLCAEAILEFAKPRKLPVLIIGHVTKDGTLAGPRVLEHLVDVVLYIEGSRTHEFRMLRAVKNRFGSVNETGIFEMKEQGLMEIKDPAGYFIKDKAGASLGSALVMTIEGSRPILLEVQALTNTTPFGYPVRRASGFDGNRLQLLIAVLQKHLKINLGNQDVYINVASGYRLSDPAADLGVCAAILSSYYKKPLPRNTVYIGEMSLTGDIRRPQSIEKLAREAKKLSFSISNYSSIKDLAKSF